MAFISFVLRTVYAIPDYDVLVQMILFFAFIWMLFRIHVYYAVILTGMGYQAYFLIQTLLFFLMDRLGAFSSQLPNVLSIFTYLLQLLSALTAYLIGLYVYKKRKGFDFIPDKHYGRLRLRSRDKVLFALNFPAVFIVSTTIYLTSHLQKMYLLIIIFYALTLYSYIYYSYKRDRGDDEYNR
jgi:hypothetical protein